MSALQTRPAGLFVVHHPQFELIGSFIPVEKGRSTVLGKAKDTLVPSLFKDTSAGQRQMDLNFEGDQVVLTGLRSRAPTIVNGVEITEQTLQSGDVVGIADVLCVFQHRTEFGSHSVTLPGVSGLAHKIRRRLAVLSEVETPVVIQGPMGTEKLRVARALHLQSRRAGAFIALDCGQLSPEQIQTHLWAQTKTQISSSQSLLQAAQNGSIFLDNAHNLTLEMVNAVNENTVNSRVVYGVIHLETHWDSMESVFLAPLRSRREDIPHWIHAFSRELNCTRATWNTELAWHFLGYAWPGNMDEMHRIIAQLCHESGDSQTWRLSPKLEKRLSPVFVQEEQFAISKDLTSEVLIQQLRAHAGRTHRIASDLGLDPDHLLKLMREWNIDPASFQ